MSVKVFLVRVGAFIGLVIVGLLSAKLSYILCDKTDKYTRIFLSIGMFLLAVTFFLESHMLTTVLQFFLPALAFTMYVDSRSAGNDSDKDVKTEDCPIDN